MYPSRHLTLLFCAVRYGLSWITLNYYSTWAQISYRTAFVAAAATYGIVVFKAYRARMRAGSRPQGGAIGLLADENVQYLGRPVVSLRPGRPVHGLGLYTYLESSVGRPCWMLTES